MAISDHDKERLNLVSPAANDVGLGDIIQDLQEGAGGGGASTVTAANITDATVVGRNVIKAVDATAARTAIGAGTSSLALGATAATAAAGNHAHTATQVTATAIGPGTATNVQGILAELAARVVALEAK
ncbi:hypothetical protein MHB77_32245 [Paenibacillus sp. FSL K6-3166]|uniref:hypothetical protein n=1 Tax=unclassified Paenibacillus TaxID=185978 RepID=UPI000BA148EE|nr:hypothetical protein [Paenibacillus sp. VTT E-133291]OZQ74839.1 hypothetical protein CA598_31365 [Paenibacillus sp. VTT E-133291]